VDDLEQEKETYLFKQDNEKQILENNLKNERLKNEELGKNINKFETMVKELTETRIMSPPPKREISDETRPIPNIVFEGASTKSFKKPNTKGGKQTTNTAGNKKKKSNSSNSSDSKNDTRELKHNISVLKDQNSKVIYTYISISTIMYNY